MYNYNPNESYEPTQWLEYLDNNGEKRYGSYCGYDRMGLIYVRSEEGLISGLKPDRILTPPLKHYDASFGDTKVCRCGHHYYRHFDTYENMSPVGCKYCQCSVWTEPRPDEDRRVLKLFRDAFENMDWSTNTAGLEVKERMAIWEPRWNLVHAVQVTGLGEDARYYDFLERILADIFKPEYAKDSFDVLERITKEEALAKMDEFLKGNVDAQSPSQNPA